MNDNEFASRCAIAALQGLMVDYEAGNGGKHDAKEIVALAWEFAEDMLKARDTFWQKLEQKKRKA